MVNNLDDKLQVNCWFLILPVRRSCGPPSPLTVDFYSCRPLCHSVGKLDRSRQLSSTQFVWIVCVNSFIKTFNLSRFVNSLIKITYQDLWILLSRLWESIKNCEFFWYLIQYETSTILVNSLFSRQSRDLQYNLVCICCDTHCKFLCLV